MQRKAASRKQHEALRVPQGWKEQDRALIMQLERILDDLYSKFGRIRLIDLANELQALIAQYGDDIGALQETAVTNVGFNQTTRQLTKTINGTTTNIVPVATLASYVDDVMEYAASSGFPATGEADKIYVALDTGLTYRWSGSQYVRLNTYAPATQTESGLMSAADKKKLDGVAEGATANEGTITGVKMNGRMVGSSGVVDLGTVLQAHQDISGKTDKVTGAANNNFAALDANGNLKDSGHKHGDYLTQHQDISGKADKSATVSDVAYNSTGKKITKTINGVTTDVLTVATLKAAIAPFTWGDLVGQ